MVGIIKQTGQVNKNSGIVVSKKMVAELVVILIVALVAIAAMEIFQSPPASSNDQSTDLQQKNTQQTEQTTYSGSETSSQANNAGQETEVGVTTLWYPLLNDQDIPVGNNVNLKFRATTITGKGLFTTIAWESPDSSVTSNTVFLKVKYRNTQTNEIMEDTMKSVPWGLSQINLPWQKITDNADPKYIEWQASFGIKSPK